MFDNDLPFAPDTLSSMSSPHRADKQSRVAILKTTTNTGLRPVGDERIVTEGFTHIR
jgi:hypothetical protein